MCKDLCTAEDKHEGTAGGSETPCKQGPQSRLQNW